MSKGVARFGQMAGRASGRRSEMKSTWTLARRNSPLIGCDTDPKSVHDECGPWAINSKNGRIVLSFPVAVPLKGFAQNSTP